LRRRRAKNADRWTIPLLCALIDTATTLRAPVVSESPVSR